MANIDLSAHGISVKNVLYNADPARLYEEALAFDPGSKIAQSGALVAFSGEKTGRSAKDKRLVRRAGSEADIWWGSVNIPIEGEGFAANREQAKAFLNSQERLYCLDAFAGWDPEFRFKVRLICARPYHALFMRTMLIQPTPEELKSFDTPEYVIFNAGQGAAESNDGSAGTSKTSVNICFEEKEVVILGTEYAGEMKKGIFTIMNYLMPKIGVLSMHCSATVDPTSGDSTLLFGLSGTGKTTLSANPKQKLIGDDEHCWTDTGVFNIEGGCYAKAINLSEESEPDIYGALRYGAVLENVVMDEETRAVDFSDVSITQNTRGAYPIEHIENVQIPCVAGHPHSVIFLTCDAFGVLPPVSRLTPEQAMYHFISGYTAKVAGTEVGVVEPQTAFSPCFGGPFLVWHPGVYAELLARKMKAQNADVWLVNTGWSGGGYGQGTRIKLKYTRAIVDAIYSGALKDAPTERDAFFGLNVVKECPEVPSELLNPESTWTDPEAYRQAAEKLARLFKENFKAYEEGVSDAVRAAGPLG